MREWIACGLLFAGLGLVSAQPMAAQQRVERFAADTTKAAETTSSASDLPRPGWRRMAVAKWSTLAGATAVGVYGFVSHREAEDLFEDLERQCHSDQDRCNERLPNGAFADSELEVLFQDVARLDRRARLAMLAGQVGLATSVLLFILDLRDDTTPQNIPYEPRSFRVMPGVDGGVELRVTLPAAWPR